MAPLRPLSARRVLQALHALGFADVRHQGGHLLLRHPDGRTTVVPVHPREDIGRGLLRKIIRDAGVDVDEFMDLA